MAATPTTAAALTMKLLVDTKPPRRVVYAEAGKEVVDFLFSLLALPLSAVAKLLAAATTTSTSSGGGGAGASAGQLDKQQRLAAAAKKNLSTMASTTSGASRLVVGSVGNLYRSVESLEAGGHVRCHAAAKVDALLNPAAATTILPLIAGAPAPKPKPKPNGGGGHQKLFRCKGCSCSVRCYDYATRVSGTPCPVCKRRMTTAVHLVEPNGAGGAPATPAADAGSGSGGGYVRDTVTYTVMDDLSVAPISTITAVTALVSLGVTDITGLQAMNVDIGYKEGLALLKASLHSQTVLTDVFLGSTSKQSAS